MNRRLTFLLLLLATRAAQAHSLGESYLFLSIHEDRIEGRVEMTLSDLDEAVGLESNADGKITEGELDAGIGPAKVYVADRVGLATDGAPLPIEWTSYEVLRVPLAQYAVFHLVVKGLASAPAGLDVTSSLKFDVDPTHRDLLIVEYNTRTGVTNTTEAASLVFEPGRARQHLDLSYRSATFRLLAFVGHGMWHGSTEPNHVLLLAALLLPSVMVRTKPRWEPTPRAGRAVLKIASIVVLFSLAHAAGLTAGARLGVALPPWLLDVAVVASVAFVALHNALARRDHSRLAAFGSGIVSGLATAPYWTGLRPAYGTDLGPFAAAHVGIGLGAVALAAMCGPVLYDLRTRDLYGRIIVPYGSLLAALIGVALLARKLVGSET